MSYQCGDCGLGIDSPGICSTCGKKRADSVQHLVCVLCRAPFVVGNPHKRCLQVVGEQGSNVVNSKKRRRERRQRA